MSIDTTRTITAVRVAWETVTVNDERYGQRAAARKGYNWFAMSKDQRVMLCTSHAKHTADFGTVDEARAFASTVEGRFVQVQVRYDGNRNFTTVGGR